MVKVTPKVFDGGEFGNLFHGVLPGVGILLVACDVFPQHPLCIFRIEKREKNGGQRDVALAGKRKAVGK